VSYTPFLTASAVDRFLLCPASATLPRVHSESAAASKGTEIHARILQPGCLPAAVLRWYGREPGYEGALGACAETGQTTYFGTNLDRAYAPTGPLWVCGTFDAADYVADVLSVGDLKTGWGQAHGGLPAPESSGQLRLLAALYWRYLMAPRRPATLAPEELPPVAPSRIRLAYFTTANAAGVEVLDAELHPDDLRAWWANLIRGVQKTARGTPIIRRNVTCDGCSAFDSCPTQGGAIARLLALPPGKIPPERLGEVYRIKEEARAQLERVENALTLAVKRAGGLVPVGKAHSLSLVRGSTVRIDPGAALSSGVLGEKGIDCLGAPTMSQESIRRGLGVEDVGAVVDRLVEAGAAERVTTAGHLRLNKRNQKGE
jgi:hypothetical protein